jgi:hypothetical protein
MSRRHCCLGWGAWLLASALAGGPAEAGSDDLAPLIGTFVGRAEETDLTRGTKEERDIDIIVSRHGKKGLRIAWTNVTLVDGRRDLPGVKRRSDEVTLTPADGRDFYLASPGYDPFHVRAHPNPVKGDPLRWAVIEGGRIEIYSFQILEDGRYELQTYTRRATPAGMTLGFARILDGEVVRRMTGRAVRAE